MMDNGLGLYLQLHLLYRHCALLDSSLKFLLCSFSLTSNRMLNSSFRAGLLSIRWLSCIFLWTMALLPHLSLVCNFAGKKFMKEMEVKVLWDSPYLPPLALLYYVGEDVPLKVHTAWSHALVEG
jgi:hypothetical protein